MSRAVLPIKEELSRITAQNLLERTANSMQDNDMILGFIESLREALTDYQVIWSIFYMPSAAHAGLIDFFATTIASHWVRDDCEQISITFEPPHI